MFHTKFETEPECCGSTYLTSSDSIKPVLAVLNFVQVDPEILFLYPAYRRTDRCETNRCVWKTKKKGKLLTTKIVSAEVSQLTLGGNVCFSETPKLETVLP